MSLTEILILSLSWTIFFCLHSLFASLLFKHHIAKNWPDIMSAYRILFNMISVILLPIPLLIQHYYAGEYLWKWSGISAIITNGLAIAAALAIFLTLKYYDSSDFSGLKQFREKITDVEDQEQFTISPIHRFVRHPWYFLILVILWTRSMDEATLISTLLITAYFTIGSRLEENKLIVYHGQKYQSYRKQVPGLIPLPWKYLKKRQK